MKRSVPSPPSPRRRIVRPAQPLPESDRSYERSRTPRPRSETFRLGDWVRPMLLMLLFSGALIGAAVSALERFGGSTTVPAADRRLP